MPWQAWTYNAERWKYTKIDITTFIGTVLIAIASALDYHETYCPISLLIRLVNRLVNSNLYQSPLDEIL